MTEKKRAPQNRTMFLTDIEREKYRMRLLNCDSIKENTIDVTILGDCLKAAKRIKPKSIDLLILDPPYNLSKLFGDKLFVRKTVDDYTNWLGEVIDCLIPTLKPDASVYICSDWYTSSSVYSAAAERLFVRNRITWEREKGRGSKTNWKNSSEDIWFCTLSKKYAFNLNSIKLKRQVIAPYRNKDGSPKDWADTKEGKFRDTHPSNLWTDITIPFWSMPENTDHPTQKSEKLIAKLILASTNPGDVVFDPFLGSGTTSVVSKKLGRKYIGVEQEEEYALLAEKRIDAVQENSTIQGYVDGVFWERNTSNQLNKRTQSESSN
jgi:site-specific DNA-methyltransferase (adenine-specific)